ncbi:MAG: patatin-like phospholipase family protein [Prevotella sp.]|nr:patatin-like phospholipase family protein [Prevotella sp.]
MKQWICACLLMVAGTLQLDAKTAETANTETAAVSQQPPRKKVGLVLSGGGAKGAGLIGVIKVLEEAGIPIDIVTGTSIGSIVGGLYSIGYDAAMMDSIFRSIDWGFTLRDRVAHERVTLNERENQSMYIIDHKVWLDKKANKYAGGIIKGINIDRLLNYYTTGFHDSISFDKLPRPFACVAFNLADNEEKVLHSGRLARAIRASMAIPGVFSPVRKDSMVLVDGGVVNNLPVDVARAMGADIIIAVTLEDKQQSGERFNSLRDIILQSIFVASNKKFKESIEEADFVINVNTHGYDTQSFTNAAIDTLINRGEAAGHSRWDDLMELKRRIGVSQDYHPKYLYYDRRLLKHPSQKELEWTKPDPAINMGLAARFDLEEQAALQGYADYHSGKGLNPGVDLTLRLGQRTRAKLEFGLEPWRHKRMSLAYEFRHDKIYMYREGDKADDVVYNSHALHLHLFRIDFRNLQFDIGASWKYTHLSSQLKSNVSLVDFPLNTRYFNYNARLHYNSENNWYFTTSGSRLELEYKYFTENLVKWKGHVGFSTLAGQWRITLPLSRTLHIQPIVYTRMIFGEDIPAWEYNMIGGNRAGICSDQQIAFAGFTNAEFMDDKLVGGGIRLQQRLSSIGYILLKTQVALHNNKLEDLLKGKPVWGIQGAYYYNSIIGPIGGYISWSNFTSSLAFGINIGYEF